MESLLISFFRRYVNWSILLKLDILFFYRKLFARFRTVSANPSDIDKKILIVKLEVLGDFVTFIPSLKAYAEIYGGKNIDLLIDHKQNALIADYLIKENIIRSYTLLDSRKFTHNMLYRFFTAFKLRKNNYSTAIYAAYYRRNLGNFLIQATGASERFGFAGNEVDWGERDLEPETFTKAIVLGDKTRNRENIEYTDSINEYEKNFRLIDGITNGHSKRIEPYFPLLHFPGLNPSLNQALSELALTQSPTQYIVINPGAGREYKRWPRERFAEVGRFTIQQGYSVLISGGPNEKDTANKIVDLICGDSEISNTNANGAKAISIAGLTTPIEIAHIIKDAKALVSNDTGIIHIGAAVHTPSVCIIGCGAYPAFYPYSDLDLNRAVFHRGPTCFHWKCTEMPEFINSGKVLAPCVDNITPDMVIAELKRFI